MAVVQQLKAVALQAEINRVTDQLIERYAEEDVIFNSKGQASAGATGGTVIAPSERLLTRLKALNAQQTIQLALLVDA